MMFLDISKKPGDPNAVVTEEQLLEENEKLKKENARLRECNAAAMREALKETSELVWSSIDPECNNDCCRPLRRIARIADAALAAPPRNCDRFQTADAAWDAWMHGPGCRREGEGFVGLLDWLYAKAKGGAE